jgi:hypothetical protein
MKIDFINENTVQITNSLDFSGGRPPEKKILTLNKIVDLFEKKHSKYKVLSCVGPERITNFHDIQTSSGTWVLEIKLRAAKKNPTAKKTVEKAPLKNIKRG